MTSRTARSVPKNSTNVRTQEAALGALRFGLRAARAVSPSLATAYAERVFLTARRHTRPAWERTILDDAVPFRVPLRAGWLPAWSWGEARGEGKTVLLVHGWEGRGSQLGTFVAPLVTQGYRVVTFDGPGHGDAPSRRASIVDHAAAVWAMRHAEGKFASIVAHSVGCASTILASEREPLADRYVFVASPLDPTAFMRTFSRVLGLDPLLQDRLTARLEARFGMHMTDLDVRRVAPKMEVPALVVHDRDDAEVPLACGETLASLWPESRLHVTTGLGHRRILRSPDVAKVVLDFVAEGRPVSDDGRNWLDRDLYDRDRRWRQSA
ncbi:MAG: alpha/beta hydrolase [Polyangiaceae bacterium]